MEAFIFNDKDIMTVDCPTGFANQSLNGARCYLLSVFESDRDTANVIFIDGQCKGQKWQLNPSHLSGFEEAKESLTKKVGQLLMRPHQTVETAKS